MTIASRILVAALLLGCSKPPAPPADAGAAAAPPVLVPAPATSAYAAPAADAAPSGPIRVEGYSRITSTGMNDPAYAAGFGADGEYFGYCASVGARAEPRTTCELVSRTGEKKVLSSDVGDFFDGAAKKRLDEWVKEQKIPLQPPPSMGKPSARELTGTWAFAHDLTLVLDEHAQGKRGAAVLFGGRVGAEAPVYPVLVDHPLKETSHHTSWVEALTLSPDGRELGLVAGFYCMEWCDDFEVRRWPVVRLASQIYNDTAMRHHRAKDYAGSAALFAKATTADPSFGLAAYNLACAYARLRHAGTKAALERAIALDPSTRARAIADADFEAVRSEPWFPR